ncbi:MAG: right-handed parallel beta-helix repeat-containing protein [Bacteroidota bacterium]|nr:right-handed parallel beta-helix repeat-containing protein [Bacteroidota bacterium]
MKEIATGITTYSLSSNLQWAINSLLIPLILIVLVTSCYKEKFTTDQGDRLSFSTDTLNFDTVLTSISTVTRYFKVYNPHNLSINIDEVRLTGPQAEFFTLNVDGMTGDVITDITIRPNDSIYVFAEATIDPDQPLSVSPFVLETDVQFKSNGNEEKVLIVAWGQNANYIPGPHTPNRISLLTCDLGEETWDDPKPYVLYGTLLIDSCTLVLPPGTRLYIHGGIANNPLGIYNEGLIYTLPDGRIRSEGTLTDPVIIRDDRIEPDHEGEWAGIRLGPASGPHSFSHTQLSSAIVGISADSASSVSIDHSSIAFTGGPGFFGRHANASISNSLFYENGAQAIALTYGGSYQIDYCTMANFGNDREALLMNNFYCSDALCSEGALFNKLTSRVNNSIMIGSSTDEVWIVDGTEPQSGLLDILMKNNIVIVDELLKTENFPDFFQSLCTDCFEYHFNDTLFVDMDKYNFHLDTGSIAEMKAIPILGISDDFDGFIRDAVKPDIGCYEFRE